MASWRVWTALILWCVLSVREIGAYPVLQSRIPSGTSVACPPGGSGCNADGTCSGIGHNTCVGGSLPLNAFGASLDAEFTAQATAAGVSVSLYAQSFVWRTALCNADSDGDGQSNGVELGDPCCVWAAGAQPAFSPASHPGFSASSLNASVAAARVASCLTAGGPPPPPAVAWTPYAPGETTRTPTTVKGVATPVPAQLTTYMCTFVNIPTDVPLSMVGWQAILDNAAIVHHMLLFTCPSGTGYTAGQVIECSSMPACTDLVAVWAAGQTQYAMPSDAGFLLGAGSGISLGVLQIHYNNAQLLSGLVDSSGLQLYFTPQVRPKTITIVWTGSVTKAIVIPPGVSQYEIDTACVAPWANLTVFAVFAHEHLSGTAVWTERYIGGPGGNKVADVGNEPYYSFNNQHLAFLTPPVTLNQGDYLITKCLYNTTGKTAAIFGGEATTNEMCINFFFAYGLMAAELRQKNLYAHYCSLGDMTVGVKGSSTQTLISSKLTDAQAFSLAVNAAAAVGSSPPPPVKSAADGPGWRVSWLGLLGLVAICLV